MPRVDHLEAVPKLAVGALGCVAPRELRPVVHLVVCVLVCPRLIDAREDLLAPRLLHAGGTLPLPVVQVLVLDCLADEILVGSLVVKDRRIGRATRLAYLGVRPVDVSGVRRGRGRPVQERAPGHGDGGAVTDRLLDLLVPFGWAHGLHHRFPRVFARAAGVSASAGISGAPAHRAALVPPKSAPYTSVMMNLCHSVVGMITTASHRKVFRKKVSRSRRHTQTE
mmetsp:Transcript_57865/g.183524  ORF Transcript_57865/g.183524 Transcript_57865/m.183524 type:complete len:224 (+) Transcript_57865:4235-4906(+)